MQPASRQHLQYARRQRLCCRLAPADWRPPLADHQSSLPAPVAQLAAPCRAAEDLQRARQQALYRRSSKASRRRRLCALPVGHAYLLLTSMPPLLGNLACWPAASKSGFIAAARVRHLLTGSLPGTSWQVPALAAVGGAWQPRASLQPTVPHSAAGQLNMPGGAECLVFRVTNVQARCGSRQHTPWTAQQCTTCKPSLGGSPHRLGLAVPMALAATLTSLEQMSRVRCSPVYQLHAPVLHQRQSVGIRQRHPSCCILG